MYFSAVPFTIKTFCSKYEYRVEVRYSANFYGIMALFASDPDFSVDFTIQRLSTIVN